MRTQVESQRYKYTEHRLAPICKMGKSRIVFVHIAGDAAPHKSGQPRQRKNGSAKLSRQTIIM